MKRIKHVVYSHRDGLRWYFIDTERPHIGPSYFISLNPKDIKYIINTHHHKDHMEASQK